MWKQLGLEPASPGTGACPVLNQFNYTPVNLCQTIYNKNDILSTTRYPGNAERTATPGTKVFWNNPRNRVRDNNPPHNSPTRKDCRGLLCCTASSRI